MGGPDREVVRQMLNQLGTLSWERYLVDFPADEFTGAAHSKICQHAQHDTTNDGEGVVSHICLTFVVPKPPESDSESEIVESDDESLPWYYSAFSQFAAFREKFSCIDHVGECIVANMAGSLNF